LTYEAGFVFLVKEAAYFQFLSVRADTDGARIAATARLLHQKSRPATVEVPDFLTMKNAFFDHYFVGRNCDYFLAITPGDAVMNA